MNIINALKGTHDILPAEVYKWQYVEEKIRQITKRYRYEEIRVPIFEYTELFARGVGDTTDVVQKEMYTFDDKGGRSLTLRPEGTAGVVRSFLEHGMFADALPKKLYYNITCYRNEKPQAGRYREFRQFGVEAFGTEDPSLDAEIIAMVVSLLKELGLKNLAVNINSIGCPKCRKTYNDKLREYLRPNYDRLCDTCKTRFEKNPLRILDCKADICKEIGKDAPVLIDNICEECADHFEKLKEELGVQGIEYVINKSIVRGLDYYTKTVFEITSDSLGAQSTVCGGGRYDGLVEELGGNPIPGIGFAMGLERLIMCMDAEGVYMGERGKTDIFVATLGEDARKFSVGFVKKLRDNGIAAEKDYMGRGLKAQMKYADKTGSKYSVVLGDNEIEQGKCSLKNMETGDTQELTFDEIVDKLKKPKG
ncbi:MAG: histidine--tRNA ligase [Bacillota bacterium]|nr:histidine--tRNA ligase [Bacillota bacterium]